MCQNNILSKKFKKYENYKKNTVDILKDCPVDVSKNIGYFKFYAITILNKKSLYTIKL